MSSSESDTKGGAEEVQEEKEKIYHSNISDPEADKNMATAFGTVGGMFLLVFLLVMLFKCHMRYCSKEERQKMHPSETELRAAESVGRQPLDE